MTTPPKPKPAYPGRPELDAANMRFRRAVAAANRYAARKKKPALVPQIAELVAEVTSVLEATAKRAEALYLEEPLRQKAAKAARAGSPRMAALLERLEGHVSGRDGG